VCVTVDIETACSGTNFIFSGAYVGPFDPNNICTNNVGDPGLSGTSEIYGFDVPAGQSLYVNVHEVTADAGCSAYTVTITGLPGQCGTPVATDTPAVPTDTATTQPTTPPTTPPSDTPTTVSTVEDTSTPTEVSTTQPTTPPTEQATTTATATEGSPVATATACTLQFSDVPVGSTFYPYIHCLVCLGIVNGYSDGTFRPNANVTRGQLSKIVSNSAGFSDTPTGQQFQDVPVGSTFYVYIFRLSSRGYINGYPCGSPPAGPCGPGNLPYFLPNASATRGQISKIVSNAAGFSDTPSGQQFQDVPPTGPGSTFYPYIYRLSTRGIINGYACGGAGEPCGPGNLPYFRPNANATRGQMSKIDGIAFFPNCNPPIR
jgi:hypothetical protein